MKAETQQKIVSDFFKGNPDAKQCHLAEDGEAFTNKSYADLHANTGKGKKLKVTSFDNANVKAGDGGKSNKGNSVKNQGGKNSPKKLSEMKALELKKIAIDLGIQHKPVIKNVDLIVLIEAKRKHGKGVIKLDPTDLQKLADDLKIDVATLDTPEKIKAAQEQLNTK